MKSQQRHSRAFNTCVAVAALSIGNSVRATDAPPLVEEEVVFRSGTVTLAGTLLHAGAIHPRGAVVLVHGSGPGPREGLLPLAKHLATSGLAALIYDKRGSGGSEGSWTDASLDDLAGDVLAATTYLRGRPELEGSRIGAFGVSQGGWVIPRAAAQRPGSVQFVVVVTGGALRPADVERHDFAETLDRAGATAEERQEGVALVERYLSYLATGADLDGLLAANTHAKTIPALRGVDMSRVIPTANTRPKWAWVPTYDPAPDIRSLQVPVLVIIGGRDRPSLAATMAAQWRSYLTQSGNADATLVEFLGAGHGATVPGTHHVGPAPQVFVPGYLEIVDAWSRAHQLIP
jgi:pimeloyl-ACP methyl ester carboxylesterase